jgi:hypothetical protein
VACEKSRPADLGYYVGYKIAQSYYERAHDKKQAIRDVLEAEDFEQFLKKYAPVHPPSVRIDRLLLIVLAFLMPLKVF